MPRRPERRPHRSRSRLRPEAIPLSALLVVGAAGCAVSPAPPAPGTSGPGRTEAPGSATPSAPATPTAPAAPPAGDDDGSADSPDGEYGLLEAYAACRDVTLSFYEGDPGLVEFAPFEEADVVRRDDGLLYVYIEVHDGNRAAAQQDTAASECILGGTIGDPEWHVFGVTTRSDDRNPNAPLPSA